MWNVAQLGVFPQLQKEVMATPAGCRLHCCGGAHRWRKVALWGSFPLIQEAVEAMNEGAEGSGVV